MALPFIKYFAVGTAGNGKSFEIIKNYDFRLRSQRKLRYSHAKGRDIKPGRFVDAKWGWEGGDSSSQG